MFSLGFVQQLKTQLWYRSGVFLLLKMYLGSDTTWNNLAQKVHRLRLERDTAVAETAKLKRNLRELNAVGGTK